MEPGLLHAAVIWAALGLGLGCLVLRLIPRRRSDQDEKASAEVPGLGE